MTTQYQLMQNEFDSIGFIRPPGILEKFAASVGCHQLNLLNLTANDNKGIFFAGGKRANFRMHINMQAPSGFMKSTMLDYFLDPETGILSRCNFPVEVEATFTPESWAGTLTKNEDGDYYLTGGIYDKFKHGIVGADEFAVMKDLTDDEGQKREVVYLLKGLEGNIVNKNTAAGQIAISGVGTTLWTCLRPTPLNFKSGLSRRFNFISYYPTLAEAMRFKEANIGTKMSAAIRYETLVTLAEKVGNFIEHNKEVGEIDCREIDDWLMSSDQVYMPHFEHWIFKRLAIGWSIVNGTFPSVKLDDKVTMLFKDELASRLSIMSNPLCDASMTVLHDETEMEESVFTMFMQRFYQLSLPEVRQILKRLIMYEGRIKRKTLDGKKILVPTEEDRIKIEQREEQIENILLI